MMFRAGRTRYGAKGIMERIRWDRAMDYPDEEFKICNSFIAMYSRLAMLRNQELQHFFSTREVTGIRKPPIGPDEVFYGRD